MQENDLNALEALPWQGRAVLLVDLDAFFASVEQLDHPGWRGKPVIVGGSPEKRGVVSTASYEARRFGVHSAMPSATAQRLCPDAIWTEGHYDRYREMSNEVMAVLRDESPFVQQVSIDEAFVDVTPTPVNREHPASVARRIQQRIEELGVTCSIGLGTTKAVAKLASDMDKPRGLTVVIPGSEANFMDLQPVRALSGIGPAAERKLAEQGIETLGQLARADSAMVERILGKQGIMVLERARGSERDAVVEDDSVKSVSNEMSFARDLDERPDIEAALSTMAAKVARRMRRKGLKGRTVSLKVRYSDRSVRSVQQPLKSDGDDDFSLFAQLGPMLDELWSPGMPLRLVGVAVTGFDDAVDDGQLSLFDEAPAEESVDAAGDPGWDFAVRGADKHSLLEATDKVKDRFGEGMLRFGRELRLRDAGTGTTSKNPADYK